MSAGACAGAAGGAGGVDEGMLLGVLQCILILERLRMEPLSKTSSNSAADDDTSTQQSTLRTLYDKMLSHLHRVRSSLAARYSVQFLRRRSSTLSVGPGSSHGGGGPTTSASSAAAAAAAALLTSPSISLARRLRRITVGDSSDRLVGVGMAASARPAKINDDDDDDGDEHSDSQQQQQQQQQQSSDRQQLLSWMRMEFMHEAEQGEADEKIADQSDEILNQQQQQLLFESEIDGSETGRGVLFDTDLITSASGDVSTAVVLLRAQQIASRRSTLGQLPRPALSRSVSARHTPSSSFSAMQTLGGAGGGGIPGLGLGPGLSGLGLSAHGNNGNVTSMSPSGSSMFGVARGRGGHGAPGRARGHVPRSKSSHMKLNIAPGLLLSNAQEANDTPAGMSGSHQRQSPVPESTENTSRSQKEDEDKEGEEEKTQADDAHDTDALTLSSILTTPMSYALPPAHLSFLDSIAAPSLVDSLRLPSISPELASEISAAFTGWNFDVFSLARVSDFHPLTVMADVLFGRLSEGDQSIHPTLGTIFTAGPRDAGDTKQSAADADDGDIASASPPPLVNVEKLHTFLTRIEHGYFTSNPYHNRLHGADVFQATLFLLRSPLMVSILSPLEVLAGLIAAAIHDVGHLGKTNAFLVATNHELADIYNDQSVLENQSLNIAFKIMRDPACNFLHAFPRNDQQSFRATVVSMVLHTDMRMHLTSVQAFDAALVSKRAAGVGFSASRVEDRRMLLEMVLHTADLANPARHLQLALAWASSIMQEYHAQGDEERVRNLPISPMMDRNKPMVDTQQYAFINVVVLPLFNQVSEAFELEHEIRYERDQQRWLMKEQQEREQELLGMATMDDTSSVGSADIHQLPSSSAEEDLAMDEDDPTTTIAAAAAAADEPYILPKPHLSPALDNLASNKSFYHNRMQMARLLVQRRMATPSSDHDGGSATVTARKGESQSTSRAPGRSGNTSAAEAETEADANRTNA